MNQPTEQPRPIHTAPKGRVLLALWEPWPGLQEYRFIVGEAKKVDRAMGWLPLPTPC